LGAADHASRSSIGTEGGRRGALRRVLTRRALGHWQIGMPCEDQSGACLQAAGCSLLGPGVNAVELPRPGQTGPLPRRKAPGIPTEYTVFSSQTTRLRARDEDQRRLSEDWPDGAKKRGGSGGSKPKKEKKKPPARALESDDGAKFMLFRVLMLANVPVSFARGSGNVAKLLSAAAHKGAMRARCGTDGRACRMPQAPLLGLEGAPLLARGRLPPS
jgi:hypothetical protein